MYCGVARTVAVYPLSRRTFLKELVYAQQLGDRDKYFISQPWAVHATQ